MISVSVEEVRRVARLARLALSPAEEARMAQQLGQVLAYVEGLQAVDVTGTEPLSFAGDAGELPLRDDVPQACLPREAALPAGGEAFAVPRIVE